MTEPERLTSVLVVRHGRTALNAQGRFRGLADPPLDEIGLAEVEETARSIGVRSSSGRPIGAIATSPLTRARQTAEAIGLVAGREPFVQSDLVDLDHGAWEGLTSQEARARDPREYERFRQDPRRCTPPGGEQLQAAERRMQRAIDSLASRYPGEEIVAVSHEIPIRLLLSGIQGIDGAAVWALELPTASMTIVTREGDGSWAMA